MRWLSQRRPGSGKAARAKNGNNLFWSAREDGRGWVVRGAGVHCWIGTFVRGQEAIDCNSDTSAETRLLIILLSGSAHWFIGDVTLAICRPPAAQLAERPPPPTPPTPAERKKRKFCPQLLHSQTAPRAEQKFAPGMALPPPSLRHLCTIVAAHDPTRAWFYYPERKRERTKEEGAFSFKF